MQQNITVAIVEDENDIREALRVLINYTPGFSCADAFSSAEDAMVGLPSKTIDVVIMDINLPRTNGIDCIKYLKPVMPSTQFMMCTVYDNDENIFAALENGATGYILKRTSPAQILQAIKDLHEGGSPMSSEIARRVVEAMQKKNKQNENAAVLSEREKQILDFLAKGYMYKEIGDELGLTKATVKSHINNIYKKLQVQTRMEALDKAFHK